MSLLDLTKHLHAKKDAKGVSFVALINEFLFKEQRERFSGSISGADIEKEEAKILLALAKRQHTSAMGKRSDYRDVYLHPSSIGGCARRTFFKRFKAPKNARMRGSILEVAKTYRIFDHGKFFHLRMQVLFVRMGLCKVDDIEVPFTHGDLQGTCDAIATASGERYIVDFKSSNSYIFSTLGGKKSKYLKGYDDQMRMYMSELGVPKGVFLYENKDTQALAEVFLELDEDTRERNEDRIDFLRKHISEKTVPPKEGESLTEFPCKQCDYTNVCYGAKELKTWLRKLGKGSRPKASSRKRKAPLPKK